MTEVLTYEALKAERDALAQRVEMLAHNLGNAIWGEQEALQRVNGLAVENAELKDINAWCKTEAFQNMYREFKTAEAIGCTEVDCMHDAMMVAIMHAPKTPATDAAIAAIQAQGVEKFADHMQGGEKYSRIAEYARGFATELREAK